MDNIPLTDEDEVGALLAEIENSRELKTVIFAYSIPNLYNKIMSLCHKN